MTGRNRMHVVLFMGSSCSRSALVVLHSLALSFGACVAIAGDPPIKADDLQNWVLSILSSAGRNAGLPSPQTTMVEQWTLLLHACTVGHRYACLHLVAASRPLLFTTYHCLHFVFFEIFQADCLQSSFQKRPVMNKSGHEAVAADLTS